MEACVYCPKLCRHVCPVAVSTNLEKATPTAMITGVWAAKKGLISLEQGLEFANLCAECGACEKHCAIDQPVSKWLKDFREEFETEQISLPVIEGDAKWVAIIHDERDWSKALRDQWMKPIARCRVKNAFGRDGPLSKKNLNQHSSGIKKWGQNRHFITTDDQTLQTLLNTGLQASHLKSFIPDCDWDLVECGQTKAGQSDLVSCCGASLQHRLPEIAKEIATAFMANKHGVLFCANANCASHLRESGHRVVDCIDRLMEKQCQKK